MLSRARFAVLVLVGAAVHVADSRWLSPRSEMAFAEKLSSGTCDPNKTNMYGTTCDTHGNQCTACGRPRPGTGYDGKAVLSSTVTLGTAVHAPDYIVRDDCGNHSAFRNPLETLVPATKFNQKTSQAAFLGWTNAWCELNIQKVCADAVANRDYLFEPKSFDIPKDFAYDFYYCKHNGWLSVESRTIVTKGFDALHNHSVEVCAARNRESSLDSITAAAFVAQVAISTAGSDRPTPELARWIGSWTCAMGGANGESSGAGCDIAYCTYTFGELDPAAGSSKAFCVYDDCEGWDPKTGMPVSEYATLARHADSAAAVYL